MSLAAKIATAVAITGAANAPTARPIEEEKFPRVAAVAGCGGNCGGACNTCATAPMSATVANGSPMNASVQPGAFTGNGPSGLPATPYADPMVDLRCMTPVAGEAVIAGGATTDIVVQPTKGCFEGFYIDILATDDANPQSTQRVLVGRAYVGDCPNDCRAIDIYSDFMSAQNTGCCAGRPFRTSFGREPNGENLHVEVTNPNGAGSVHVQVIVRGYCMKSPCSCV